MSSGTDVSQTTFILTDLETTGFSPTKDAIIEIAMVKYVDGQVVDTFETLVNPQRYVSPAIQNVTGIVPEELKNAPTFEEIFDDVYLFIGEDVLVAHNIGFDYSFLKTAFKGVGVAFHPERLCTVQLSRKLFPQLSRYSLDHLISAFDLTCPDRHRAMGDVAVMVQLFDIFFEKFNEDDLSDAFGKTLHKSHIPPRLQTIINDVPNTPGVYFFYDENGTLLYIGKSIHLKERIKSHFSETTSSHYLSFNKLIADIDYEITAGDIEAQLKEARYIKEQMPIHNQQLRRVKQMVYAVEDTSSDGYLIPTLTSELPELDKVGSVIGMYRSRKRAKEHFETLIKDYDLCDALMGLQNTKSACFGYHLNRCQGACLGEESFEKYNLRFQNAFQKSRLRDWPYDGPVAIKERNEEFAKETVHVVDRWCYLGSADSIEKVEDALDQPRLFDHDMYTILVKALFDSKIEKIEVRDQGSRKQNTEKQYAVSRMR